MSQPNPPGPAARSPRWLVWLGVLFFAAYGTFIYSNVSNVASSSDASGYLNSARLLAAGQFRAELRTPSEFGAASTLNRLHFVPLGFWPFPDDPKITPTYPSGAPLHFALAATLVDWIAGPRLIGLFAALGAVGWCYACGREVGLDARLAAAGAFALGVCPVFLFTAFLPMSDALACTWCLAAVWAALRARRAPGWAVACGAAFAMAVLVRPTNVLLLPALLVLLGWDWRRLALTALGGLPGVAWLAFYNHVLYGSALRTGYGDWSAVSSWDWVPPTAWHFTKWLALMLPAPLLLLPFATLARSATRTREVLALAVWFAAITAFYVCYQVSHETWWCLRFIVPALPALILGGLLGVEAIIQHCAAPGRDRFRALTALGIAGWALGLAVFWNQHFSITETKNGEKAYSRACAAALAQFPPGTLIVTTTLSGAFYYYTDFPILRWEAIEAADFARYAALAQKAGRMVAAVNFKSEEQEALRKRCPGNWVRVGVVDNVGLWRLAPILNGAEAK